MLHNGTGTHQPMSMPQDLTLQGNVDGNGEQRVENGVNGARSLTKDLIGATLPVVPEEVEEKEEKEEEKKMVDQKDDPTTSTGLSSEKLDEVILSVQSNDEIFDLQKIREKIESKKKTKMSSSAKDEIRKAMAEMARIEHYPEPQYVVYANDYIEELQFYIEM